MSPYLISIEVSARLKDKGLTQATFPSPRQPRRSHGRLHCEKAQPRKNCL